LSPLCSVEAKTQKFTWDLVIVVVAKLALLFSISSPLGEKKKDEGFISCSLSPWGRGKGEG